MSRRDYRHREAKKPKKDTQKLSPLTILPSATEVEVVGKGKKKRESGKEEG